MQMPSRNAYREVCLSTMTLCGGRCGFQSEMKRRGKRQSGSGRVLCRSCATRNKLAGSLPFVLGEEAAGVFCGKPRQGVCVW